VFVLVWAVVVVVAGLSVVVIVMLIVLVSMLVSVLVMLFFAVFCYQLFRIRNLVDAILGILAVLESKVVRVDDDFL